MRRSLSNAFKRRSKGNTPNSSPRTSRIGPLSQTPSRNSTYEEDEQPRSSSPSPGEKSKRDEKQSTDPDAGPSSASKDPASAAAATSAVATASGTDVSDNSAKLNGTAAEPQVTSGASPPSPVKRTKSKTTAVAGSTETTAIPPSAVDPDGDLVDVKSDGPSAINGEPTGKAPASTPSSEPTLVPSWVVIALSSGGCAAINGVLAKLTTTQLTRSLAVRLSNSYTSTLTSPTATRILSSPLFPFSAAHPPPLTFPPRYAEVALRSTFFTANLALNAAMWSLFTLALTKGSSSTKVSLVNTSANFVFTALLGWGVFGEDLPAMWWAGAVGLVAGNVIAGMKREETKD